MHWQICLVVAVSVAVAGCGPGKTDWSRLDPPVQAPDFTLARLDGGTVTLSDYREKVVIMEFWATWCVPCRYSTPSLEVIYRRYHDRGVAVLLINAGEDANIIREWAEGRFTAPMLLDSERHVRQQYGIQSIPQLFLIDQTGEIIYHRQGYGGGLERNLKLILDDLLDEAGDVG